MGGCLSKPPKGKQNNNSQQARPSGAQNTDRRRPTTSKPPKQLGQAAPAGGTVPLEGSSSKASNQKAKNNTAARTTLQVGSSSSKAKPSKPAKAQGEAAKGQTKKATNVNSGGPSNSSTASKTAAPRLLEVFTAPHDDPSLTKAFTAAYRALLDHSVDFYSAAGWKGFKDKAAKATFLKYFTQAETLLKDKNLFKWVMLGVIAGSIWDWADQGSLFHHFRTVATTTGGSGGAASSSRAAPITRIDRNKFLNVLKTEPRPFADRKELEQKTLLGQLSKLLLPFIAKKQQQRHSQSLISLISKILDVKILLEIQPGKWGYRTVRNINIKGVFESPRMEVLGGPANGKVVQGICWPGLEKGGEGAGGKVGERGVVLARMKVLVRS